MTLLGFISIVGSTYTDPQMVEGDFGANGPEPGNTIIADLRDVDLQDVYIANHVNSFTDRSVPAPPEPSYGNVARIPATQEDLLQQNPGLDYIPSWVFTN